MILFYKCKNCGEIWEINEKDPPWCNSYAFNCGGGWSCDNCGKKVIVKERRIKFKLLKILNYFKKILGVK